MSSIQVLLAIALLVWSTPGFTSGEIKDSLALKYGTTIKSIDLERHLNILASDEYEGRETGKKGQKLAAEYISKHFQSIGLPEVGDDGYYQRFPLVVNDPKSYRIESASGDLKYVEDFYFFRKPQELSYRADKVVFAGYGIESESYSDYKNIDVAGGAVIILDGEPTNKKGRSYVDSEKSATEWSKNRKRKIDLAAEKGASIVFTVVKDFRQIVTDLKHYLEKPKMELDVAADDDQQAIPNIYISAETANALLNEEADVQKLKKKINKKGLSIAVTESGVLKLVADNGPEKIESENVLGYIKGSDKAEEVVVITAHYDHIGKRGDKIYNGADDDGTGTVALLEIAEAFAQAKKEGKGPRRSILVMPVSGEEKGLLGSKYYVDNPVFELENTVADLNIDMIGRLDKQHADNSNYVYLIGSDKLSTDLHEISEQVNETYVGLDLDYTFNDPNDPNRFYYRSDHYNFAKNNIPVIFYFNGVHEDYHKATDTVDKIDFNKVETISRLVFYTAWDLANREERIKVDVENDFK